MNLVELASRIRAARLRHGYTLDQVAELSGLAKGQLSKIENFRVTPSLPTLVKLCETLDVRLSELLDGLEAKPKLSITRCNEGKDVERDREQSNIRYLALAHQRPSRTMDPFKLTIPAQGGRRDAKPHEGEEFLIVLDGAIHFEFNGEVHEMAEGDSAYFDAEIPHRVFNPSDRDARILCIFTGRSL